MRRTLTRRAIVKYTAIGLAGVGLGSYSAWKYLSGLAVKKKRNVLFIMSDQHNARALGCYGNKEVKTPNLDRLASEGVVFDQAFCQTGQCCPSRYSIWTGRYARSHGLYYNDMMESPEEKTVGDLFKSEDYVTATIGKHHMHMKNIPDKHGFDHVIDDLRYAQFIRSEGVPAFTHMAKWLTNVHTGRKKVGISAANNDHHPSGFWASQTIKFLRKNKNKPFCAWLSFYGPHSPIAPSRPWATQYNPQKLTLPPNNDYKIKEKVPKLAHLQTRNGTFTKELHGQVLAYYYGLISQIDYNIGRVLKELDSLGLSENTIVVYTADHGDMMAEHGAWTKGRHGYDATIRVPLIIRLPGVVPVGKHIRELACSIDLLPTLLDLTEQAIPMNVQGSSLVPLLRGSDKRWRDTIFSEIGRPGKMRTITARTLTQKYVVYRKGGEKIYEQFFDLERDPWEMSNEIANQNYSDAINKLKIKLATWEANTEAAPVTKQKGLPISKPLSGPVRKYGDAPRG